MVEKKTPKRILIDVQEDTHTEVKKRAILHNMTIKQYVLRALSRLMAEEDKCNK